MFLVDSDLQRHLDVFGRKNQGHGEQLRERNWDLERGLDREHGGADRVLADVARIVEEERDRQRKIVERALEVDL
jgi:hypothetical protein